MAYVLLVFFWRRGYINEGIRVASSYRKVYEFRIINADVRFTRFVEQQGQFVD